MAEPGPVTCAGCGLLCDDVIVQDAGDGVRVAPDCRLGTVWFSDRMRAYDGPPARINGEPVDVESALTRAAELLRGARRPLLDGFDHATIEDARAAVALADRLGAVMGTGAAAGPWPGAPAMPLRGVSTATLGEIRDRSRVVVIWREDPLASHPRLLERLRLSDDRALVVIDDEETSTAQRADAWLRWPRDRDLDALTSLHVMQRGLEVRPDDLDAELNRLIERVRTVPHAAFVYGPGLTAGAGGQRRALALHELVRAMCDERHVVTLELPRSPGWRSADEVLAWQSGYGWKVDFAVGHPELVTATQPFDDVDVTLLVEAGARSGGEVALGGTAPAGAEVWIRTAPVGTVHRLDGVPLPLQAPEPDGAPTAAALLTRLLAEIDA